MKRRVYAFLSLAAIFAMVSATDIPNLTIQRTSKPVKVDGIIDSNDPWGSTFIKQEKQPLSNSTNNASSEFQLMYDNTNLYLAVKVIDGTRNVDNITPYLNDLVGIYIDLDTTTGDGIYKPGITFDLRKIVTKDLNTGGGTKIGDGILIVETNNGDSYIQEWSLPWALLSENFPLWDWEYFKFDIQTADAIEDGVRTQQLFWHDNSDLQWNNTSKFGLVKLSIPDTLLAQTINFEAITPLNTNSVDYQLSAISTSGLPITFSSSNPKIATIINNKIHVVGAGTCAITASQEGNAIYRPAKSVSQILKVQLPEVPDLIITKTPIAPLLDGKIDSNDPWENTFVKQEKQAAMNTTVDASSEFQLMYNNENLFITVKVKDTTRFVNCETAHINDCVELFIDLDTTTVDNLLNATTIFLRKIVSKDLSAGNGSPIGEGVVIAEEDDGKEYIQEWSIPWKNLLVNYSAWDGNYFKFEIQTSDATTDGVRTQQMIWHDNSDFCWMNARILGLVQLSNSTDPILVKSENNFKPSILLYPNPTSDKLNINISDTKIKVEILSMLGVKILTSENKTLDVSNLTRGNYFVRITTENGTFVKSFIKN